jgi:hypothetical protein
MNIFFKLRKKAISNRFFIKKIYYYINALVESDKHYSIRTYRKRFTRNLNLKLPQTFNEKLNWLRLYDKHENWSLYADKYAVRDYIKNKIGEKYLIPLINVYNKASEIDFDLLPDSFVMKANHGSGWNIICTDKSKLNTKKTIRILKGYLQLNYYHISREVQYKDIVPKIVCEKFIGENGKVPEDYKFFCFYGKPLYIQVDEERQTNHVRVIYDTDWNLLPLEYGFPMGKPRKQPDTLDEMLGIARKLSENEFFVRIDLYSVNSKVYFGEMTFTPGNATEKFVPESYDYEWGQLINLPI